jgi:hypothetical protein
MQTCLNVSRKPPGPSQRTPAIWVRRPSRAN